MTFGFVFPGQGSQSVGMLAALAPAAGAESALRDTFAEASAVLGYDLWQLVAEGPAERLNSTECTQPAMLAASVAIWRLWRSRGGAEPQVVCGHSLGEFSALVAADALDFSAAVHSSASAAAPCRRPCRRAAARWPRFWAWMTRR